MFETPKRSSRNSNKNSPNKKDKTPKKSQATPATPATGTPTGFQSRAKGQASIQESMNKAKVRSAGKKPTGCKISKLVSQKSAQHDEQI